MDAGIKVVGFDSSPAVGAYDVFVNQVDFSGVGVNLADWACELAPSCTGDIAILSAAATATNQNAWIDLMKTTLATDKYKGLKLVDTVYGDDDATKSTQQAQALLTKYPNLKVIVAPTTVGILAAAQVVKAAGKSDSIKVTGLGFPHDMKPFVEDGTSPVYGLWNVPDLGYLSYSGRGQARQGRDHGQGGRDLHGAEPQRRAAVHDRQGRRRHPRPGLPVRQDQPRRLLLDPSDRNPGTPQRAGTTAPEASSPGLSDSQGGTMERVGFRMRLLPGAEAEYRRRHAAVWPEMLDALRSAGARDYTIFLDGDDLFGYLVVDDFDGFRSTMAATAVNDRWQADMAPLIDPLTDPATGFHRRLDEVFHLD